ncbi:L-proline trans-4-hydroxylase-like [Mytilus trossulus]|uniref:L-proline trans-4-hydroxylase-like n=1 Tax=Mytilus trossulus TaxID=6551 RepID=UPI003003FD96
MEKLAEYNFTDNFETTDQMVQDFKAKGFLLVRNLFDKDEVEKFVKAMTDSDAFYKNAYVLEAGERKVPRITWSHPGSDVTGLAARSEKVVNTCEKLLGGEVYHYHSKYMLKDAKITAPHYWHQDYGYWYNCGNLYPDMMTVWVALDKCTKKNSCLEILSGSNSCGRIEHHPHDGQIVAKKSRVDVIREKCPHIYAEMNPGDALFFHCNTLHHSSANRSNLRRWAYIMCYNKATNNPTFAHHHAQYTPIEKVPNSAIKECTNLTDLSGKEFIHPNQNASIAELFAKYSANPT